MNHYISFYFVILSDEFAILTGAGTKNEKFRQKWNEKLCFEVKIKVSKDTISERGKLLL
jgi:hypothetical protein